MKKFIVSIREKPRDYPVVIGETLLETCDALFDFGKYSNITVITGADIPERWLQKLRGSLPDDTQVIKLPAGEKYKNIETVIGIWDEFNKLGLDRKSLILNLGGGVICDVGGFAASTYMRGIDFIQIPTTVLAQVDASVGGKVGVNFKNIKNYIGLFRQPVGVIIDVNTLSTLPQRIYDQGFAEIYKHGLINDRAYFEFATSKKPKDFNTSELTQILAKSVEIKSKIIEEDQTEHGIRRIINFGHTVGHAIESLSLETKNPLLHGEAVQIGMLAETKISQLSGLLPVEEAEFIYERLSQTGLPLKVKNIKIPDIISKLSMDKKSVKGQINWTLLKSAGIGIIDQKVDNKTVLEALKSVIIK